MKTRHCPHCKSDTVQEIALLDPDDLDGPEVWECSLCLNAIDFVANDVVYYNQIESKSKIKKLKS